MVIIKNLSSKNKVFIKTFLDEFPLLICSFFLLSPYWISSVKNDISSSSYKERSRIVFYKSDNMATDSTGFLIYEKIIK